MKHSGNASDLAQWLSDRNAGIAALQAGKVGGVLYLAPLFQKFNTQRFIVLD